MNKLKRNLRLGTPSASEILNIPLIRMFPLWNMQNKLFLCWLIKNEIKQTCLLDLTLNASL